MIWILRHKSWLSSTENRFSDGGLNKTYPQNRFLRAVVSQENRS